MKRLFLILSLIVLLASIFGVYKAFTLPLEIEEHATLLNYEHEGRFDYLVYLKPSYLFDDILPETAAKSPPSNPKYPTEIIDRLNMTFAYRFVPDEPVTKVSQQVEVKAVLDKEEVILVPTKTRTGDFTVKFSLDASQLASTSTITITAYVYATVETDTGPIFETFSQSLAMQSNGPLLEVDKDLTSSQDGSFGGLSFEQIGVFDYSIRLKSDSAFGAITLKPPSVTPPIESSSKILAPGDTLFSSLIDTMDATIYYEFTWDQPLTGLTEEGTITAILENPEVWSKTFVLVPLTKKSGDFSTSFPMDINHFTEMLEAIRSETGVPAESYNLTITADVHTVAQTDFGEIDEVLSQTLSSELAKGTLEWNEELVKTEPSAITTSQMIPNPNKYVGLSVSGVRILAATVAGIVFLLCLYLLMLYMKFRPAEVPEIDKEAQRARKKYKDLIVDIRELPEIKGGETVISLNSLDDLITAAEELLKPVLHKGEKERHTYCAIDGLIRYQYVSELEPPDRDKLGSSG